MSLNEGFWVGGTAQAVKYLPWKLKDLSLDPRSLMKSRAMCL